MRGAFSRTPSPSDAQPAVRNETAMKQTELYASNQSSRKEEEKTTPPSTSLPETAPTNVMLAQVLQIRRLPNEPVHLVVNV